MEKLLYRKDNKKLLIWVYIAFLALIITSLVINILNTKKILNMYIILFAIVGSIIAYFLFYIVFVHKHKEPLKLEDNNLAFYVSFNKHNTKLKVFSLLIDILSLLTLASVSFYFLYVKKLNEVYGLYPIFGIGIILLLNLSIIIRDILKLQSMDSIDANTSSHQFSIYDKKIIFALNLLLIEFSNIRILSVKKPHFVIYYNFLLIFEILATVLLTLSLLSILITKIYYYSDSIKQIEQTEFNTRFLEEIGEGKYAKVYKAFVPSLNTVYAVKKLESKDVSDIERFKAEFNIMKMLDHNNLIHVYSFDEIKYEYVKDYCNYSLEDYLENHKLSNEEKRNLTIQLLDSFDYLHKHGIMHRDVSPSNVMIKENSDTNEATIKVLDFGLSKNTNELKKTRTFTRIRGTLFDPTLKDFSRYNEQNDIYGLGVLINYINYQDDSIIQDDSDVSKIVNKCMDLNLCNRYHHVNEIIEAYKEASL
jgi:hypothetical protein